MTVYNAFDIHISGSESHVIVLILFCVGYRNCFSALSSTEIGFVIDGIIFSQTHRMNFEVGYKDL